jgi:hypothetical protein
VTRLPSDENLAYHAARLLVVIFLCGKPQSKNGKLPAIEGRTLLAKLDFFVRYPSYLERARELLKPAINPDLEMLQESQTVESRMIRFRYGPWDHLYYVVIAYLIGKRLVDVERGRGIEIFRITTAGITTANIVKRAQLAYTLFNNYSGSRLKTFIYDHFPEIVARNLGDTI